MQGGCHCGAVRHRVEGAPQSHALCHCADCRRHAGAPLVGWAMYPRGALKSEAGVVKIYASSEHGRRHFCSNCGTGLFYTNDQTLPGIVDVQSATFDDPSRHEPQAQIQVADRIAPVGWAKQIIYCLKSGVTTQAGKIFSNQAILRSWSALGRSTCAKKRPG